MPRVILKGSQQCQWDIGGHMFPGGVPVELTEKEIKDNAVVVLEVLDKVKEFKLEEVVDSSEVKDYTKAQLVAKNKQEQVEILKENGIDKVPKLEAGRVKAILDAQKARGEKK